MKIENLSKTFPGQRALDSVSLEFAPGEVHSLVGQNGSGKSTLIKILSGFHDPDHGARFYFEGEADPVTALTPEQQASMRFIHQDLALLDTLSVRDNLSLDRADRGPLGPIKFRHERSEARKLLALFELTIDPEQLVGDLSPFEKSAIAVVRAVGHIDDSVRLLVLDEPTASMDAAEARRLFGLIDRIKQRGIAVLYVSHILPEVLEISDRITVLRDGKVVARLEAGQTSESDLIEKIVGSAMVKSQPLAASTETGTPSLKVTDLTTDVVIGASFQAHSGEVLGLTGLVGSGYEDVPECLGGSRDDYLGTISIGGKDFSRLDPATAADAGLAAVPADRRRLGLIPHFTIAENVTLPKIGDSWHAGFISSTAEERDVRKWLDVTDVRPPDPKKVVQELSGGNQQKVMIAKALRLEPEVLVVAEPTQAVDVGAAATIRRLLTQLAADGKVVLIASSDPEELEQVCQRVLVFRNGRIAAELTGDDLTEERIAAETQFDSSGAVL